MPTLFSKHHLKTMVKKRTSWSPSSHKGERRLPGFTLTQRDLHILVAVYECRALTAQQVEWLFWKRTTTKPQQKTHSNCQRRLRLLSTPDQEKGQAYLRQVEPKLGYSGNKQHFYWLARRGAQEVADLYKVPLSELDWNPRQHAVSDIFLDHLEANVDVRIAVTIAAELHNYQLLEWRDDRTLKRDLAKEKVPIVGKTGATEQAMTIPDDYCVLDIGEELIRGFWELDRKMVTGVSVLERHHDFTRKIQVYKECFKPGGLYEQRYGKGGRLFTVTTGAIRLANLKRITEEQGGKARYWFTLHSEVIASDILHDPIWRVAGREGLFSLIGTKSK